MIAIPIILFLLPLLFKLKDNFEKWKINVSVNHNNEFIAVALAEIPAGVLFCWMSHDWWSLAIVPFMMMSWFWFLFDGFYNLLRRSYRRKEGMIYYYFTWWYTGTNDKDDATTDNFLQRLKLWQHIAIKLSLIVIFTTLYIFL